MGCTVSRAATAAVVPTPNDDQNLAPPSCSPPRMRKRSGIAFRYSSESVREAKEEEEPKKEEEEAKPLPPPLTGPAAYRLGKALGSGGFSVVREALRLRDGARFAAKVIPMPPDDDDGDDGTSSFPPRSSSPSPEKKNKKNGGGGKKDKNEQQQKNLPPPSTRAEVEREVACLRSLPPHPNVVQLVDAFADPSQQAFVVVTELLKGGELLDALLAQDGGAYPEATAAAAAAQVAAALAHAHAYGVVHRDVKLDNVLLAEPRDLRSLKLADFGLSAALAPSVAAASAAAVASVAASPAVNENGSSDEDENENEKQQQPQPQQHLFGLATVCGTPAYVAPEVLAAGRGGPRYGAEADCWSLGVLVFTLLGGYQPFWAENEAELFGLIRRGEYDRFEDEVWSGVSDEAKHLISSLLIVDPRRRLSARGALEHPWMAAAIEAGALAPGALPAKEEQQQEQQQQQKPVVSAFATAAAATAAATAASRSLSSALPSMQTRVSSSSDADSNNNNALALRRAASLAQQARNARGGGRNGGGGGGGGGPATAATAATATASQARQLSSPLPPLPPHPRRSSLPLPQPPVSAFAMAAAQQEEKEVIVKVGASSSSASSLTTAATADAK